MDNKALGKKVFVGMSGGVDSSVSAFLLKKQGYDVTGVFIKVWQPDFIECTSKEDRLDAMRVASLLNIPFITLDLEKEYKEGVIDYMIDEYKNGRTPNPDVMCNREVKFGAFFTWARSQGADYIATGHYAQNDGTTLITGTDTNKDQTYFLWALKKELLPYIIFPVGDISKPVVRKIAAESNLPVSTKKDSQGLCFVGTVDVKTLLKKFILEKKGNVVNEQGEIVGSHTGVVFYTIGERHGFTINKKGTNDTAYFIVAKDVEKNTLTVSHIPPKVDLGNTLRLEKYNWTMELRIGEVYQARARYRAPLASVRVVSESEIQVIEGELTKASGQSLVLYDGKRCVGGGIIV